MQVRIPDSLDQPIRILSALNRRSVPMEVAAAIEAHLNNHKEELKSGPKLDRLTSLSPATKRAPRGKR